MSEGRVARSPADMLPHNGHTLRLEGPGSRNEQLIVSETKLCGLRTWLFLLLCLLFSLNIIIGTIHTYANYIYIYIIFNILHR